MRQSAALWLALVGGLAAFGVADAQSVPTAEDCKQVCGLASKSTLTSDQKQKLVACVLNHRCANSDDTNRTKTNPLVGPYNSRF